MSIKERTIECDAVEHDIDETTPVMIERSSFHLFSKELSHTITSIEQGSLLQSPG